MGVPVETYFAALEQIEYWNEYCQAIGAEESVWKPRLQRELTELAAMRDRIIPLVMAFDKLSQSAREYMVRLIQGAWDEANELVNGPSTGSKGLVLAPDGSPATITPSPGGPGFIASFGAWLAKLSAGKIVALAGSFLGLIAFGPVAVKWAWRQMDDDYKPNRLNQLGDDITAALLATCAATDMQCKQDAIIAGQQFKAKGLMKLFREEFGLGTSCGMLETPLATILGTLLGAGLGYVGMRKVFSL